MLAGLFAQFPDLNPRPPLAFPVTVTSPLPQQLHSPPYPFNPAGAPELLAVPGGGGAPTVSKIPVARTVMEDSAIVGKA